MTTFKTKREIDAHVHDIMSKVNNQSERVIRSFAIARMYYDHREYLEARKYLEAYLSMNRKVSESSEAHKLMGEILYCLGDMNGALENYKNSFRANGKSPRDTLNRICDLLTDGYGDETQESRQKWFDLQKKEVGKTPKLYSNPNLLGSGGTPMREVNHYYISPKVYNNNITTTPPSSNNNSAINGHLTSTPKRYSNSNGYISPNNTSSYINNNKESLNNSFSTPNSKAFLEKMIRIVEQNEKIINQNDRIIDVVTRIEEDVKELKISKNFETTPFAYHNCSSSNKEKITTTTTPKKEHSMSGSTLFSNLGSGAKNAITFGEMASKNTPSSEIKFGVDLSKVSTVAFSGSPSANTSLFSDLTPKSTLPFADLASTKNASTKSTPPKPQESPTKSITPSQESNTKNTLSEFKFGFDFTKGLSSAGTPSSGNTLFSNLSTQSTPSFADLATTKNAPSFAELASKNTNSEFKFGVVDFTKGFANSGAPVFGNIGAGTSVFGNTSVTEKDDDDADGDVDGKHEEYEPDVQFKPIYPLPPLIDVKKGDENENVVFEHRAKILRFDSEVKEWKERGVGNIKILQHKENKNKARIIMWREQVLKLACNHYITAEMVPEHFKENRKTLMWTAYDYSDDEPNNEIFVARFGTEEKCLEFKNHFLRLINEIAAASISNDPSDNETTPKLNIDLTPKNKQKVEESTTKSTPKSQESTTKSITPKSQESTTKNTSSEFKFGFDFTKGLVPLSGTPSGTSLFSNLSTNSTPSFADLATTKNASSFADLASKNTTSEFKFGMDFSKGFSNSGAPVFGNIGAGTSVFGNTSVNEKDDDEADGDVDGKHEEYEPDVQFKPIYPLPPLIDVKKGDENENVVFEHRAKILRFDSDVKEWKERGVGNIKILQDKENKNKARIVMWREQVLKLACNHYIMADMVPNHFKENKKTLMWTAYDYSDDEPDNEIFVARFGTEEKCLEFKNHFLRLINDIAAASISNDPSNNETSPKLNIDLTHKNNQKVEESTTTKSTPPKSQESPTKSITPSQESNTKNTSPEFKFGFDFTKGFSSAGTPSSGNTLFSNLSSNSTPSFADLATTKNAPSFAELASKNTTSEFKFGVVDFTKGFANSGAPVFGNIGAGTSVFGNTSVTEKDDDDAEGDGDGKVEEYEPDVIFKPIYPLPPLIDVKKGDENENVVFEHRAKILRFDSDVKEWKERGVGNIKILQDKENKNKARIVMWREQVLKLACNHYIMADMVPNHFKENKKTLMWTAYDYSDDEPDNEIFVARFGTEEKCLEFKNHFLRLINDIAASISNDPSNNETSPKLNIDLTPKNNQKVEESTTKSTPPKSQESTTKNTSSEFKFGFDFTKGLSSAGTPSSGTSLFSNLSTSSTPSFADLATTKNASTFADLASKNTTSEFKFGMDFSKGFANSGAPVFGNIGAGTSVFGNISVTEKDDDDADGDVDGKHEEYEPDVQFKPIYPLPPLIDVKKGDENENVVFEHRAKILRFDSEVKEWKERGVGNIKILQHKENKNKARIIMWREQVLKLACNHYITAEMVPEHFKENKKTLMWTAYDYSDDEPDNEIFVARFKNEEKCLEFKNHFLRLINEIKENNNGGCGDSISVSTPSAAQTSESSAAGLEIIFEKKLPDDLINKAIALNLPPNFFSYEQDGFPKCAGCRGCDPDAFVFPIFENGGN